MGDKDSSRDSQTDENRQPDSQKSGQGPRIIVVHVYDLIMGLIMALLAGVLIFSCSLFWSGYVASWLAQCNPELVMLLPESGFLQKLLWILSGLVAAGRVAYSFCKGRFVSGTLLLGIHSFFSYGVMYLLPVRILSRLFTWIRTAIRSHREALHKKIDALSGDVEETMKSVKETLEAD